MGYFCAGVPMLYAGAVHHNCNLMKNTFSTLALFLIWSGLAAQITTDDIDLLICKEQEAHQRNFTGIPVLTNPLTEDFDLKYYRFEWYIDPAVYQITGKATVYFQTLTDNFSEIHFDFSSQLGIDSIRYHGQPVTGTQSGDYLLTVPLPSALPAGRLDSLTIAYSGAPPSSGFGSFIQSQHNGTPSLWTLSEPYGAQDWWPAKNGLDDKIDSLDIFVTTPAQYRAAGNGLLVQEYASGEHMTYHWHHRYPIAPYLVAISVTNFVQYTDMVPLSNGVQLPMLNYVYPENLTQAQNGTADLVQVLQFYDSLFVSYPFYEEKYGHAQFGWGGGMEHQTMSYVINFGWGLLAHELAHQWFGDMVTCGSWQHIWLNEGFATYLEGLTRERFQSPATWYSWKANNLATATSQPSGSVMVDDTTSVNRIFSSRLTYSKGAYLLHMLRWKLGDEDFFQGVRDYLADRRFKYARTPDLKAHLEAASGQDLTGFFADWFQGQGYPSYQVQWEQNSRNKVFVQIDQTTSNNSVDFFEMPVPLVLRGAEKDSLIRLDHAFNGELFEVPAGFAVDTILFDPDLWLLSKNNTVAHSDIVGTREPAFGADAALYPNPAGDFVRIQWKGLSDQLTGWQLFNGLGQVVGSGEVNGNQQEISLSGLPSGSYFLRLITRSSEQLPLHFVKK